MPTSEHLLRDYARTGSEEAFRELVARHLNLVFSTARRVCGGDAHFGEDVAQIVFQDLARKAAVIPNGTIVAGWLHRHASFTATKMMRTERRRVAREQRSTEEEAMKSNGGDFSARLEPALEKLRDADRDALVLRFFEDRDYRDVGNLLGISEDAAQKRVNRALEKLRAILASQGVTMSAPALALALGAQTIAAPSGLVAGICQNVFKTVTTTSITPMTSSILSTTKAKMAALAMAAALSVPLLLQRKTIQSLNIENQTLARELAKLQPEKTGHGAAIELERLRRENAELHKLRAEVTDLRRALRELAAAPTAAKTPEEAVKPPAPAQVLITAQYAEFPPAVLSELQGLGIPLPPDQASSVVLSREQTEQVLAHLQKREGDLLTAPKVSTLEGRQARIAVEDTLVIEGQTLPVGTTLDVLPIVSLNRLTTTLKMEAVVTEFLGFTETTGHKIPRLRVRKAASEATVREGETILLQATAQANADGSVPEEVRKLLVLLSSRLINPDGSPLALRED